MNEMNHFKNKAMKLQSKLRKMKTLKLQVGKTYRSRKGEVVKIVRKIDSIWPFVGDNEESYREQGRYYSASWNSPYDLIEEVEEVGSTSHTFGLVPEALTAIRYTFDIPDGMKKGTVSQEGNRIIVEMVPKEDEGPKPGDVMINKHGSVYIFKENYGNIFKENYGSIHTNYAFLGKDGHLIIEGHCFSGRPATPEEAQPLWDALKKAGKRWNPETMQVEEIAERERIMDFLQRYGNNVRWNHEQLCLLIESYLKHKEGEK